MLIRQRHRPDRRSAQRDCAWAARKKRRQKSYYCPVASARLTRSSGALFDRTDAPPNPSATWYLTHASSREHDELSIIAVNSLKCDGLESTRLPRFADPLSQWQLAEIKEAQNLS